MENTNTSLVEVTEVVAAVKRLSELGERMRAKLFGFSENDICHIDSIIDALHELELHKCNAKDILETETIKCAAVRHKLIHFPDEINREIHEAVLAARLSNEASIDGVKKRLEQLLSETDQFDQLAASVEAENDRLRVELTDMKTNFDAHFSRLNELLAEKAACQIELNNLRESVRSDNARMVDLEEDTLLLSERMVEERQRHADTMRSLREQTTEVNKHLKECTAKEDNKRREFLADHATLEQSSGELNEISQEHDSLEHDVAMLQVQQQDAVKQRAQQQINSEQLKSNIEILATQSRSRVADHQIRVAEMQKTLQELEVKSQEQTALKETAMARKTEVTVRTVTIQAKEETIKSSQDTKEILREAKKNLATRETDLSKMRQEILDLEGRHAELEDAERAEKEGWLNPAELLESGSQKLAQFMESRDNKSAELTADPGAADDASALPAASVIEIQDTIEMHRRRRQQREARMAKEAGGRPALFRRATEFDINSVLAFNQQIAEWKEKLEQERTERLTVQSVSEKLKANIKQFKADDAAEVSAISSEIDEFKHEKAALEEEQDALQSAMRASDLRRSNLTTRLADERRQLEESRSAREAEANRLAADAERLRQEASTRRVELDELTPKFAEFERFYQRTTDEYNALKRSLAAVKNRKSGLEDSSRRAGQEIDRLSGEIASLRVDKERRTAQSTREFDSMAEDRVRLEREIYVFGCKLQTVLRENAKLASGVDRLEGEMRSMRNSWERAVPAKARIEQQREFETRHLASGRRRDTALADEFQIKDRHFLTVLAVIISDTNSRQAIVDAVSNGLAEELAGLDNFLQTSTEREA